MFSENVLKRIDLNDIESVLSQWCTTSGLS